jgi:MFS family permease
VQRFGARAVSTFGMVVIGVTFLLYQLVDQTSPAWLLLVIFFLQGMGMANVMPPATTTIMTSLPREKAGVGSSVSNTVRQVGGALGVAVLGTLLTTAYRGRMQGPLKPVAPNASVLHDIDGSIQATKGAGQHFPALARFYPQADAAFIHAMHLTVTISAIVAFLAALVSLTWLPRKASGSPAGPQRQTGSDAAATAEAAGVA